MQFLRYICFGTIDNDCIHYPRMKIDIANGIEEVVRVNGIDIPVEPRNVFDKVLSFFAR